MRKESTIKIANRFCEQIKREILLLPARVKKDLENNKFEGFALHNLASPCEILVKYHGEELIKLGYNFQVERIKKIGAISRILHLAYDKPESFFVHPSDNQTFKINLVEATNEFVSLVPVLFFI